VKFLFASTLDVVERWTVVLAVVISLMNVFIDDGFSRPDDIETTFKNITQKDRIHMTIKQFLITWFIASIIMALMVLTREFQPSFAYIGQVLLMSLIPGVLIAVVISFVRRLFKMIDNMG
jgi:vacuolar-type H+-ATPase subunit I/STV1